jgi:hypothetical protein
MRYFVSTFSVPDPIMFDVRAAGFHSAAHMAAKNLSRESAQRIDLAGGGQHVGFDDTGAEIASFPTWNMTTAEPGPWLRISGPFPD